MNNTIKFTPEEVRALVTERELTDEGAKNVAKRLDDNDASAADIAEAFLDDPNGYTEYE